MNKLFILTILAIGFQVAYCGLVSNLKDKLKGRPKDDQYFADQKFTKITDNLASQLAILADTRPWLLNNAFEVSQENYASHFAGNIPYIKIKDKTVTGMESTTFVNVTGAEGKNGRLYIKGKLSVSPLQVKGQINYFDPLENAPMSNSFTIHHSKPMIFNVKLELSSTKAGHVHNLKPVETVDKPIPDVKLHCKESPYSACSAIKTFLEDKGWHNMPDQVGEVLEWMFEKLSPKF